MQQNISEKSKFKASAYLQRTGLNAPVTVSEDGLVQIHRAQAYSIPFENFDIQLGRTISLSPHALFEKMVFNRRGGYCFELNGLFYLALCQFGFEVQRLLARVHLSGLPTARTHQLLLVTIAGRKWVADVGFGSSGLHEPIPFELGRVSEQVGEQFRLVEGGALGTVLQVKKEDHWQDLYSFDLAPVYGADIVMSNHFTQSHPDSYFTHARVATLPNSTGRVSLLNYTLRRTSGGVSEVIELEPGAGYLDTVEENFGIKLDRPYESLISLA